MTRKIFILMTAILFSSNIFLSSIASAENSMSITNAVSENFSGDFDKYLNSLPQKKGAYKSSKRPILLEGAMNIEIEKFVYELKNPAVYKILNYVYIAGTYKNYPVIVARTEQGMENAAAVTALAIENFNPVAVINQGTAGGHDPALHIGDIVIGERTFDQTAYKSDYAAAGAGVDLTRQEMRGAYAYDQTSGTFKTRKEYFPDATLLKIAKDVAAANDNFNVVTGVIATGNIWLSNIDYISFLHETYGSSCEEMETNAAAQICQNAGVPFIGIRVLSNNITVNKEYVPATGTIAQNFVLLVAEDYIRDVLKK